MQVRVVVDILRGGTGLSIQILRIACHVVVKHFMNRIMVMKYNNVKFDRNDTYYQDELNFLWSKYGHEPDMQESPVGEKEVK